MSEQQKKISVLIPYHNSDGTIAETLSSIDAQGFEDVEIVIGDDHSSPKARAALDALVLSRPNITIIDVDGRGPSAARNAAVKVATGKILCFLDADDCLRAGALQAYSMFLEMNPDIGIAFGRVRITPEPGEEGGIITPYCAIPTLAQIIGENRVCTTSNIVVRKDAFHEIGGFDETLSHAEDQEWLARAYDNRKWKLAGMDQVTLDYRTSSGGLSSDLRKMETGWRRMVLVVRQRTIFVTKDQIRESTGLFYRYLARRSLRLGHSRTDGIIFISRAVIAHPSLLKNELRRTWSTIIGSLAVFFFGSRHFGKLFH